MVKIAPFLLFCCVPFMVQAAQLDLMTGPKTGTYYTIGKDISDVAKKNGFVVDVLPSEGSVDNIKRMNQAQTPSLAIVQSDVLGFLNRSNNPALPKMLARLRVISPFYMEEVHVLARRDIHAFNDLQNMRVAVGEEGSGHMLTAVNLFAIAQITPTEIRKISPEEGVVEVLRGNLDAVIVVGGKPLRLFKNLENLSSPEHQKFRLLMDEVHFLPMNNAKFYEEYEPTEIAVGDYDFVKATVPTISVQSMLVSLDSTNVSGVSERCEALKKLLGLMRDNKEYLKRNGHPKWYEVNFDKEVVGWKKDTCVWQN